MAYRFSAQAEKDIYALYESGKREFGERSAEIYFTLLIDAAELAARQPVAVPIRPGLRMDVRVRFFGSHLIVYQFDDLDILILRILHQLQDWEELL